MGSSFTKRNKITNNKHKSFTQTNANINEININKEIPIVLIEKKKTYPNNLGDGDFKWQTCYSYGDKDIHLFMLKNKEWNLYYEKGDDGQMTCFFGKNKTVLHFFTKLSSINEL
ncbi:MAG: hypothetical protein CMF96_00375 [Candidatus Marinimicrobia bacterium]|nr:hypothetical protein [Candidatus Neomarinimicrobiota bacterium]